MADTDGNSVVHIELPPEIVDSLRRLTGERDVEHMVRVWEPLTPGIPEVDRSMRQDH